MHVSYSERELFVLKELFKNWDKKGNWYQADQSLAEQGVVSITITSLGLCDGTYATIELHKLKGEQGFFGPKTRWVSRSLSHPTKDKNGASIHGCCAGKNQLDAVDQGVLDIQYRFMSKSKLESYM